MGDSIDSRAQRPVSAGRRAQATARAERRAPPTAPAPRRLRTPRRQTGPTPPGGPLATPLTTIRNANLTHHKNIPSFNYHLKTNSR